MRELVLLQGQGTINQPHPLKTGPLSRERRISSTHFMETDCSSLRTGSSLFKHKQIFSATNLLPRVKQNKLQESCMGIIKAC